jgi:predicted aspartyl protease
VAVTGFTSGFALLLSLGLQAEAVQPPVPAASGDPVAIPAPAVPLPVPLDPVDVTADEPRFVAPTRRDRIGRIWAPVLINGQGPFRLVLDTGASHSALTPRVAQTLGIPLDTGQTVMLRGATGSTRVPMVPVESLEIGDLLMYPRRLPIVPDALGGAEGVLGTDGLDNKRIHIDFRRDRITIKRSRAERAEQGFITVPVQFMRGKLIVVDAYMGGVPTKAVIDTGGQATLGNAALKAALEERRRRMELQTDQVIGATLDVQEGDRGSTPALMLGDVKVNGSFATFADFAIFEHWKMTDEPAILVGMDVLGLLDALVIDYRRKELQVKLRQSGVRVSIQGL